MSFGAPTRDYLPAHGVIVGQMNVLLCFVAFSCTYVLREAYLHHDASWCGAVGAVYIA